METLSGPVRTIGPYLACSFWYSLGALPLKIRKNRQNSEYGASRGPGRLRRPGRYFHRSELTMQRAKNAEKMAIMRIGDFSLRYVVTWPRNILSCAKGQLRRIRRTDYYIK